MTIKFNFIFTFRKATHSRNYSLAPKINNLNEQENEQIKSANALACAGAAEKKGKGVVVIGGSKVLDQANSEKVKILKKEEGALLLHVVCSRETYNI